jgi:Zn-finger nucleic acid-binding protein
MPLLLCPNCNTSMQAVNRSGVELDMCPSCRGVWLDRGEMEKILEAGREQRTEDQQSRAHFDREVHDFHRDPEAWR